MFLPKRILRSTSTNVSYFDIMKLLSEKTNVQKRSYSEEVSMVHFLGGTGFSIFTTYSIST